jgi:hypothetical protein
MLPFLFMAAFLLAAVSIRAGTITVTSLPSTGTDAATGINSTDSPTNHYVCCLAFGTGTAGISVNGVPFQHEAPTGALTASGTDPVHGGSWTLTANHNLGATSNANWNTQADGNTAKLLYGPCYVTASAPANSWLEQTYGGLTAGAQYAFRLYYRQWVSDTTKRTQNIVYNGEGANQLYSGNPLDEDAGGAAFIEYDFTAVSNSVTMFMTNLIANESSMAYAISIRQTAPAVVNSAPSITSQPVGLTNWAGLSGTLNVGASGTPAPSYQWFQNNSALSGQTNLNVSFSPLVASNSGSYYVIVSNVAGAKTSSIVAVDVLIGTNVIISNALSQVQLPATGTDAATGIGTGGNYLCALDFGPSGATYAGAVNGINFTPVQLSGTNQVGVDPNYGGTWEVTTSDGSGFIDENNASSEVSTQADGNMQLVLTPSSSIGSASTSNTITFDFGGLALGAQYALRYYYRQWDANDFPPRPVQFTFNGNGTNSVFETDEEIGGAYYIEYDFTATGGIVSMVLLDLSGQVNLANWPPLIYAITLQQTAAGPASAPVIDSQPAGFTNWAGFSASLSVFAAGSPAPAYQWFQNNVPLAGETNLLLSFSALDVTNAGSYDVVVSNAVGVVTSSVVTVGVLAGTNVISPTLWQVQLPSSGTDAATGIGVGSNYLCALDFGSAAFSGAVNGITFTPVNLTGTNQSGADPNYGGTWQFSTTDTNGFKDVNGGGAAVGLQADPNMEFVLNGASYLGVAPVATTATLNFGALDAGAQYLLCYYYRQWDANDNLPRPVQFAFNGNGANSVFETDEDLGGAYYIAYNFTAATNAVSLVLTAESSVANQGPMIYAVTLQLTAPVLNYSLSGTSLTLSWDPSLTNYVLQSSPRLDTPSWTTVAGVVNNSVMVDASAGPQMFFRLQEP